MGGIFALANTSSGGLAAHIKLQKPRMPLAPDGSLPAREEQPA